MQIHTSSWHYHWYSFLWQFASLHIGKPENPENLCQYTRFLIFRSLIALPLACIIYFIVGCIIFVINLVYFLLATIIFRSIVPYKKNPSLGKNENFDDLLFFLYRPIRKARGWGAWPLFVLWLAYLRYIQSDHLAGDAKMVGYILLAIVLAIAIGSFLIYLDKRKKSRSNQPPSIIAAWIEAKHRKICPLIEVVDDSVPK